MTIFVDLLLEIKILYIFIFYLFIIISSVHSYYYNNIIHL